MAALLPIIDHPAARVLFALGILCAVAAALAAARRAGPAAGWIAGAVAVAGLLGGASLDGRPRLSALLFHHAATVLMKAAALGRARTRMPLPRLVLYLLVWPGLDPRIAATRDPSPQRAAAARQALRGAAEVAAALLVARLALGAGIERCPVWPAAWTRAVSLTLLLDGWMVFAVAVPRLLGRRCEDAFREPWRAASLAELWGERWNLFVSRSLGAGVFRPVARVGGPAWALLAAFLASGLLHELLWGVPGRGPLGAFVVFFAAQAMAILAFARWLPGRGTSPRGRLVRRASAWAVLLATAPLFVGHAFRALLC
jgi:hypothetical protein